MTKKLLAGALALSFLGSSALAYGESTDTYETYNLNQPINRIIFDRDEPMKNMPTATETTEGSDYYNDPYLSYQWAITETNAEEAWENATENYAVVVAVIDTGVDYTHEDLENRVLWELGYDFVNDDSDAMDDNGHGTHVSGIIAAEANNGLGISGIAGELDVSILPIKALDADGVGETEDIVSAIYYAVEMDVDIINLSLGANTVTPDIRKAIETAVAADIFIVVAAGNDSSMCSSTSLAALDGVFTVAASEEDGTLAYFSNYGSYIDGYAPGTEILSTYLNNEYAYQDGTSMAAPMVSGAAAILLSQNPDLTVDELTALLSDSEDTSTSQQSTLSNTMGQSSFSPFTMGMSSFGYSYNMSCSVIDIATALSTVQSGASIVETVSETITETKTQIGASTGMQTVQIITYPVVMMPQTGFQTIVPSPIR